MGCSPDIAVVVWREEALAQHERNRELEARASAAEADLAVALERIEQLKRRMGALAEGGDPVEDAVLQVVDGAIESTIANWKIHAPHSVAARHLGTNVRLAIRAAFAVEEPDGTATEQ
jgi:hypothetical protein